MSEVTIYFNTFCPKCDSENIKILEADENTYFCYCKDCKKRFQRMRT
jgi:hypothetical protein